MVNIYGTKIQHYIVLLKIVGFNLVVIKFILNKIYIKYLLHIKFLQNYWNIITDLGYENNFTDETTIEAENFTIFHDRRGVISLANDGKNHNGPQFVVSLNPNPWMDKYYVAFG